MIKEIIDAERWTLPWKHMEDNLKQHNTSLDRIEAAVTERIAELELELQRYKQAPNLPHIIDGSCNTTHYACDCVLKRIVELEAQLKNAKEHANAASSWMRRGWISKAAKEIEKIGGDA